MMRADIVSQCQLEVAPAPSGLNWPRLSAVGLFPCQSAT
jgi:hypothetical protein